MIVLLIGLLLYLRTEVQPGTFWLEETPYEVYYEYLCLAISLLGLVIRIITVGYTPGNTSGRNVKNQLADSLNTTGMYSIVRHPLYLGNFFMWLGPAMLTGNFWFIISFCLFFRIYYERIMLAEELFLRDKFGSAYLDWAAKRPPFMPRWKAKFVRPALPFSWKKVLKKEKNGLAAIFIIFFVFDALGELIENKFEINWFIFISCIVTCIGYLILKYLKKYTHVLDEEGR